MSLLSPAAAARQLPGTPGSGRRRPRAPARAAFLSAAARATLPPRPHARDRRAGLLCLKLRRAAAEGAGRCKGRAATRPLPLLGARWPAAPVGGGRAARGVGWVGWA
jgi:hypothetical protein